MRVAVKTNSHVVNTSYVSGTILCIFRGSPPLSLHQPPEVKASVGPNFQLKMLRDGEIK